MGENPIVQSDSILGAVMLALWSSSIFRLIDTILDAEGVKAQYVCS